MPVVAWSLISAGDKYQGFMDDVRDAMSTQKQNFGRLTRNTFDHRINFSEFPIIIVNLTGPVPTTMARVGARIFQDALGKGVDAVLEAGWRGDA